ncbi:beta strand repeat-containing protein [Centipeda periodontii]|uniref:beta strand repeat-containing protein n=1 Tax=Centipeda periodontii TaxID=82203 RepID=UPI00058DD631|nr:YDG domain-containing protein [Centipeda periodontii]
MKSSSKASKHIHRVVAYALFAGVIAAPFAAQTAYALPIEGANAATNAGEANISTSGTVMDIAGKTAHNILRWEDFSIEQNEKVRFDGGSQTRDYLNLVTGEGASNIYGTIEGGRNVYLVNPHGILFAKDSQVNTGALYLSTANPADIATATNTFKANGTSPLSATAQMGDVLNLGTVKASKLYIEGKNVKVLNTDAVTDANGTALTGANVTIRSEETPHIGYDVGNRATANFDESGGSVQHSFYDYAHPNTSKSASGRGWDVADLGGTAHTDYDYMRVHTVYDLQNINAKLDGRYILAGDIDAGVTNTWNSTVHGIEGFLPIGENVSTNFTGRFDGAGHTLRGLYIKRMYGRNEDIALFGYAVRAHIENLSLVDAYVEGTNRVGGIVGYTDRTVIRNVSYAGRVVGNNAVGGIVGYAWGGSIQNAWNTGEVRGSYPVGGIAGIVIDSAVIQNVCNTGAITGNERVGGIVGAILNSTLQNAWNTGTVAGSQKVGGIVGKADVGTVRHAVWKAGSAGQAVGASSSGTDVTDVKVAAEADMKLAATYTDWKDAHGNVLVATEGGKGTPWRIYEGHTTPLLTALMKGTKRLEKTYDGKTFGDGDAHILSDTPLQKNVGTYDARGIYSDTFGYDLIGSTYRIAPRVLTMSGVASQTKTYDGNTNADATQFHATLNNVVTGEESLVTATARGAAYNSKNVATASKVTYTGLALTGTGAANYTVATTAEGAGTITARALTLGAVAAQTKTYDGTTAADASKFRAGLNNTVAGDSVTATATGAAYNSKDVAGANTVNYTGVALGGADAGNYSLAAGAAQGTGSITQRALTLGTVAAQSKTYDGTTAADTATFRATLDNVVAGEESSVTATATGAAYNDKTVAGANKVSYTGVALQGTGAGNYSLAATTAEGVGTIAKRALTVGTVTAQTKTYDGTTAADAAEFQATLGNTVTGDSVSTTATGAAYNDKNVAAANRVDYTGVALTGADAGNYSLAATTAQSAGTITRRALTVDTVAAQSKTYDGNTSADTSKFHATLGNFVAGEEGSATATAAGATYNDKNVAGANKVSYTGVALQGTGAGNYTVAATAEGAGTITPKQLNLALAGGARFDKTYDGNANVTQSLTKGTNYTLTGFIGTEGDHLALASATGAYMAGKDAGTDKEVTFKNLTLMGTGAGNYTLDTNALTGIGTIARRTLTVDTVAAQTKTYDGTTAADAAQFRAALSGTVAGDSVTAAATGATYNNKNVAGASTVGYTGVALRGADAANYSLAATTAQGAGSITHRTLTLTAAPQSVVQGEALPSFTGRADGFADGEDASVFGADGIAFGTAANTDTPGSYGITGRIGSITGGVLGNYRIMQAAGNATAFTVHAALPSGILAALVQDAAPRFDTGFDQEVYVFGLPRPIPAATLGFYRFTPARDLGIEGLRLD